MSDTIESPSAFRPKLILLATTVAAFMGPFDANVVNLALPRIGGSLHAQLSYLIWIPVAYLLVSASLQATMGWMGDFAGRKRIFTFGILLFTLGSVLASLSNNILVLIANRVIQGAGAASMSATSIAIVTDTFRGDRGRALGINISAVYSGLTLGPIVGGVLVQAFGWRSIFYVNIPVGITAFLLTTFYLPRDHASSKGKGRSFDLAGSATLLAFLVTLMLFLSQNDLGLTPHEALILGVTCAVSFAIFILNESRFAKKPVIDLALFTRNRLFAAANATAVFNYLTFGGTVFIIPIYLQLVRGYSPLSAGLILFAQPIVQTLTAPVAGALSDHIDARILSSVGMTFRSVGLFALSFLTLSSLPVLVWLPLALIGLGHGLFSPPNTNSLMSSVSQNKRGIAAGILGTIRTSSNSAGVVVMGAIIAASMPLGAFAEMSVGGGAVQSKLGELFVVGMHYSFLFAAAFSAVGIFTSLVRGKEERLTEETAADT